MNVATDPPLSGQMDLLELVAELDAIDCPDLNGGPWLLDAFCCQGGATRGYQQAGFKVLGVDIDPQPNYCGDAFVQADAVAFIRQHGHRFAAAHASPPCQRYTNAQRIQGNDHPDLVDPTRAALEATGHPWVIENVVGAPLRAPVMLCGAMFPELRVYRHRLFETGCGLTLEQPAHPDHVAQLRKMGRPPQPGDFMHVVGNFSGVAQARQAMGIEWMTRDGLRESIPPAYARFVGRQFMEMLEMERAA